MTLLAAFVLGYQLPPAEDTLKSVIARYQKLKSLTVKVVHHSDILADAKDSTDTVSWLAPKRFEIISNRDSIPKLASDGKKLTTFIPQVAPISEPLVTDEQGTKPWEARGGILLSILMKGSVAQQWLHPAKGIKATFSYGKTLHWHDIQVSEVVETLDVNGTTERLSFYLSANYQTLRGLEVALGPQSAWTEYDDEVQNPDLPKTLGDRPGGQPR